MDEDFVFLSDWRLTEIMFGQKQTGFVSPFTAGAGESYVFSEDALGIWNLLSAIKKKKA